MLIDATDATGHVQPGTCSRAAVTLAVCAVCIELCVSANLLTWIGLPYVSDGGVLPLKLHPGTDLLLLGFFLMGMCGRTLLAGMDARLWVFLASIGGCLLSVTLLSGSSNLIVLLDTFLPAGLLAALLDRAPAARLRQLRLAMQILLSANAALALLETGAHATLVPLYLTDGAYHPHQEDFRPTALFDHPLTGSLMMMVGLALPPAGKRLRLAYQALLWTALVVFGGRMAIAITIIAGVASAASRGTRMILSRDARLGRQLTIAAVGLLACALAAAGAVYAGIGERLATHLYWDASAQVRLAQWQIVGQLDASELIFGTPREHLLTHLNTLRLGPGVSVIENFWLLMFVSLGTINFPLFLLGFGALFLWCWRRAGPAARAMLMGVMIVASSSNSLGRKSTVLVCLVGAVACMPRTAPVYRRREWPEMPALPRTALA